MADESKGNARLEIGHVLFLDIVGYSKLLTEEQTEALHELNRIVLATEAARAAETTGELLRLPTGDGMALVFTRSVEEPVECALQISQALRAQPSLPVRMGIHSGPVHHVTDVNERKNIAGAGINIAQRVMDCGDAGHILVSKRVADDLVQYRRWQPYLHDLGDCEVKHGVVVSVVNIYADVTGNPALPKRFDNQKRPQETAVGVAKQGGLPWHEIVVVVLLIGALGAGAFFYFRKPAAVSSRASPAAPLQVVEKSIAVLPFDNLSSDKENVYFTDGVQDEILTNLARIADLKVISRTSSMQYKSGTPRNLREIGQQLGVAHLLEGSVQRAGGKVRVNAQLIDARTDAHSWAQVYDRPIDDVFAIQSEIAKAIADQLQAKLSAREKSAIEHLPTNDVTAFDLYSRAKSLLLTTSFSALVSKNLLEAVDLLNQAIAHDPSFFLAHCELATAHDQMYFFGGDHSPARLALAQAALEAAFRLQPDAGEAHIARAEHLYRGYLDYDGALTELELARQTLPNNSKVFLLIGAIKRRRGEQEEGLRNFERSVELDPRNFFTLRQIANSYQLLRRYPEEAAVLDRALSIKPDDDETKVYRSFVPLNWKGETQPLHQAIEEVRAKGSDAIGRVAEDWVLCALAERDAVALKAALAAMGENSFGDDAVLFDQPFGEGLGARMSKDETKARAAFGRARANQEKRVESQPGYGGALCVLGLIDAGLGRKEEALREGRRAMELLPIEKDRLNGALLIEYFAVIAAWVGEKDIAIEHLTKAVQANARGLSYGTLKLYPYWDPLRGDPRFEKIVSSLAPEEKQ